MTSVRSCRESYRIAAKRAHAPSQGDSLAFRFSEQTILPLEGPPTQGRIRQDTPQRVRGEMGSASLTKAIRVVHRSGIDCSAEIVRHTNSPACPTGMLEINPAFGCQFRCAYCGIYALERDYFDEVIVYDDYPDYLDRWLHENRLTLDRHYFYFSAKTECLQPALIESGITQRILQALRRHRARYFLVTKAGTPPLGIREALINARDINQVIISGTVPDESWRERLEPDAAPIDARLAFAEWCVREGIYVTASCCPVLPIGDFGYVRKTIVRFAAAGVKHFYFDFARLSGQAVANLVELLPEFRTGFEHHYLAGDAQVTRWKMPHRGVTIDKFQPPLPFVLTSFEELAAIVRAIAPHATVSVCNHFATPRTLPGFNDRARAECISCIGHRFAKHGC